MSGRGGAPIGKTDGAWRKIEIKPVAETGRTLRVRSRRGYFGPYLKPPAK